MKKLLLLFIPLVFFFGCHFNEAELLLHRAYHAHLEKNYHKAIELYTEIITDSQFKHLYIVYEKRAGCYEEISEIEKAMIDYKKAVELDSMNYLRYFRRGNFYSNHEEYYDLAISDYSRSIEINPTYNSFNNRGLVYDDLEDFQKAIDDYLRAIAIDSSRRHVYNNLGVAYRSLNKNKEAIDSYTKSIQIDSNYYAFSNRADLYRINEEYEKALEDSKIAIGLMNNEDRENYPFKARGKVYYSLKNYKEALAYADISILLNNADPIAYTFRGDVYIDLKRYSEAIADYSKAIQLDSLYAYAYRNRATAKYLSNGGGCDDIKICADLNYEDCKKLYRENCK